MRVEKIKLKNIDRRFLIIVGLLLIFGLFMLFSASFITGAKKFNDPSYYLREQILKGVLIGLVGFFVFSRISLEFLKKYSFLFLIFSIGLLILVFFPELNFSHSGSTRWLSLGPLLFQPSEILKLAFLIYLASWMQARQKDIGGFSNGLLPFLIVIGIIGLLLLAQPNMGTFSVIAVSAAAIYFVAGGKLSHLGIMGLIGVVVLSAFIFFKPYAAERFKVFFNPQNDTSGAAYQINQSLTAIGVGGVGGIGIKQSLISPYLPETIGDSIFAVLGEKLGLFGISFSIILYLLFAIFGYRIAIKSPDYFSKLLTVGIVSWITAQSFINMAAISGLIPLTGVPLPFMSYGSSGLVVGLIGAGIIANISRRI
ncbi:MAG: putative peptidoglycan glycosyltransferase FtsW [Candidatus Azambacteria bacterium]|nr:putative peptidoglycan glycosyltransferase FtsW [Candidatus Azambacteria bacterium]